MTNSSPLPNLHARVLVGLGPHPAQNKLPLNGPKKLRFMNGEDAEGDIIAPADAEL